MKGAERLGETGKVRAPKSRDWSRGGSQHPPQTSAPLLPPLHCLLQKKPLPAAHGEPAWGVGAGGGYLGTGAGRVMLALEVESGQPALLPALTPWDWLLPVLLLCSFSTGLPMPALCP